MTRHNNLSHYKKQVLKHAPLALRKRIKTDLDNSIRDFLDENPDSSIEDIENVFGTAESFADEYILAMDVTERNKTLLKAKWIKHTILLLSVIIVLIILVTAVWVIIENSRTAAYYYETIING